MVLLNSCSREEIAMDLDLDYREDFTGYYEVEVTYFNDNIDFTGYFPKDTTIIFKSIALVSFHNPELASCYPYNDPINVSQKIDIVYSEEFAAKDYSYVINGFCVSLHG